MKHSILFAFAVAFSALTLSACGKKSDTSAPSDSTKAAATTSQPTASSPGANPMAGKYPVKSGIIHGETETMGMKGTTTKYFDDYGAKICEENSNTISFGKTSVKTTQMKIIKDGWLYSFDMDKKTGTKMKFAIPANMDFKNMGEDMKKEMGIKEEGTETILGKECKVYEYTGGSKGMGMSGKSWIFWNVEPMKMDMTMGKMSIKSHVTSIEENPSIPASKFEVPADIKIQEVGMNMPSPGMGK
ncbi:MAG: hypothetical protein Q8916_01685 [Bacteroidota bacterium]|nr:hypothetical protein [Bacteroidota bacterium]MDP4235028.1 hypothetical protein [Bacteroidota bacterium]